MTTTTTTMTSIKSKRGRKYCPQCNKKNGPRTKICNCGYIFQFKDPSFISATKSSKTKFCPDCGSKNKPRAKACIACDTVFKTKSKISIKNTIDDWKTCIPNTIISIVAGSGPYYTDRFSNKINMGETGTFKVVKVLENGLMCYGNTIGNSGYTFVYMGTPYQSKTTNIHYEPHQIILVKAANSVLNN